ncbi:MAG: biotin carboxylase N-terminal domain-containing protein, partial [Nitratireductor sp.]
MTFGKLLIANRGEIAIRIARAASEVGLQSVAVYSDDDARSLHLRMADEAVALKGSGAAAYLDMDGIIAAAKGAGCDAIHPGYGFLSENAAFAAKCADAGLAFVGPRPEVLDRFGDKASARALAAECDVPLLEGTSGATSLEEARDWFKKLVAREGDGAAIMLKAVAGGGGRGMRAVRALEELDEAYARCQSEAKAAFGIGDVYLERFIPNARHIEVQILGDGTEVTHLWERECTIQRRHQKLMEIAPSPSLSPDMRERLIEDALTLARRIGYDNIGTFEFLVDADRDGGYAFIEANARLQVEHTVT